MGSKTKVHRLESEIEKFRTDANWPRVMDLARQAVSKSGTLETYADFLVAESKLERFLLETPPSETNIGKAQEELDSTEKTLLSVIQSSPQEAIKLDCELLLAKIHYAMGNYKAALARYDKIDLNNLTLNNITNRRLKLIGEAFAVKGHCLEKLPPTSTSKFKLAEREETIIRCFELSGDISIAQLQEKHDKGVVKGSTAVALQSGSGMWGNLVDTDTTGVGPIVETAIQRSPILQIRNGELSKGVGRFRELLMALETRALQGLRQTLARQLAEVLLRGICENSYQVIDDNPSLAEKNSKKPFKYSGDNLFRPANQTEESLLLLLISESIATREAILNRSSELKEARLHTFHNTTAVYDLLTIALVRRAQFQMLSETFERAMKFSFDEFHIWYQFALSLICAEKFGRAYLVLKECLRLRPDDPVVLLQAAKVCYENLGKTDKGLEYAKICAELDENPLKSKAFVLLGIGYSLKADESRLQAHRQDFQRKALDVFQRATALDSNDYQAEYHVALQLAMLRRIPEAMKHVQIALQVRGDHVHSLHLLALLLSAQRHYSEALDLLEAAVLEYPENFSLLFTKSKLEEVVHGPEEALQTCKTMLVLWKNLFEPILANEHRGTGLLDRITSSHRSLVQLHLMEFSDIDSGSVHADSVAAASRIEQALSEVASSVGQTPARHGATWSIQTQIWLHLAELYMNLGQLDSAQLCILEAGTIFPCSHMVSFMKGCLYLKREELNEAKQCFENSVSVNPVHIKSLQYLGHVLHKFGNDRMAEKVLRDAVNADPTSSQSWNHLGKVLESLGDYDASAECLMTSVELESTNPIVPFTNLPKN